MAKTVPNEVLLISLATPTCEGTMMANIDTSNAIWNASIFGMKKRENSTVL
jgi:hypothetical protein